MGILSDIELFLLSLALGTDLFSVAIPIGMKPTRLRIIVRAAFTVALFHIVFILTGYHLGIFLGGMVERMGGYNWESPIMAMENWATVIGALVLISLGIYMLKENLYPTICKETRHHPLRGSSLLLLATSVSIDALAAGFSMGMMDVDLIRLSVILGTVIFIIGIVGLRVGNQLGKYVGKRAELVGGLVLILLGIHVLFSKVN